MQYRQFGTTGKNVSLIGVGTVRFSPDQSLFSSNVDIILHAMEIGVNYFDTASTYVSGISDSILGTAFRQIPNNKFYVSTKSMISRDPTADSVLRRVEAALKVLHVERITFFHMWNVLNLEQYKKIIAPGGPYEGAVRAKEQGLIDHICFSAHCDGNEISQILDDNLFDGVTLGYNAINYRHRLAGLQKAAKKGLGTAVMNPLGGGLIPSNPAFFNYLRIRDRSVAESAVQFVAAHQEVSTILIGVNSMHDLTEAVEVIEKEQCLSAAQWRERASLSPGVEEPLCTMCGYCDGCPADLRVDKIMGVYNELILSGGNKARFNEHKGMFLDKSTIDKIPCVKCGKCESKCTQHLPIIERIKKINALADAEEKRLKALIAQYFPEDGYLKTGVYGLSIEANALLCAYLSFYGSLPDNVCFFDTKSAKWGTSVLGTGHKILPPSQIRETGVKRILITAPKYVEEIKRFLKDYIDEDTVIETFFR